MNVIISQETLRAYLATNYVVQAPDGRVTLRIGQSSAELAALHALHGVRDSCFITAYNPFGIQPVDPDANVKANRSLESHLLQQQLDFYPGYGQGEDAEWPAEPSFLVLGVSAHWAQAQCRGFEQNAVVAASSDATPYLIPHPDSRLPVVQEP